MNIIGPSCPTTKMRSNILLPGLVALLLGDGQLINAFPRPDGHFKVENETWYFGTWSDKQCKNDSRLWSANSTHVGFNESTVIRRGNCSSLKPDGGNARALTMMIDGLSDHTLFVAYKEGNCPNSDGGIDVPWTTDQNTANNSCIYIPVKREHPDDSSEDYAWFKYQNTNEDTYN